MKETRKICLYMLLIALLCGIFPSTRSTTAKAVKLSSKKLTITKGKTKVLKVKNAKVKAKWSIASGKKNIALKKKQTKSVTIQGQKAGTAKVRAKVGKKKLTCKVTVKAMNNSTKADTVSEDVLAANIAVNLTKIPTGVLAKVTNNNKQWIGYFGLNCTFNTSEGVSVNKGLVMMDALAPGATYETCVMLQNDTIDSIDISKTQITNKNVTTLSSGEAYTDQKTKVSLTSQKGIDGNIAYTVKNSAGVSVSGYLIIYFYDESGNIIDADTSSFELEKNKEESYTYDVVKNCVPSYSNYKIVYYVYSHSDKYGDL